MERRKEFQPTTPRRVKAPQILLPPYKPPTPEELERRQRAAEEILRLRSEIGPVGRSVTELVRQDRDSH
ncbi:MAG: hypothetical protein HY690_19485 [Chloroflexi bacterium]|nr:hypothetical protein [Chloroflexota bacterium]